MGTSTVSGPFRSANGFQQLDENGVWVPVTGNGGGGGGSVTQYVTPMGNNGAPVDVQLPNPRTQTIPVGTTYEVVIQPTLFNGTLTPSLTVAAGDTMTTPLPLFVGVWQQFFEGDPSARTILAEPSIYIQTSSLSGVWIVSGRITITYTGLLYTAYMTQSHAYSFDGVITGRSWYL